MKIVAVLCLIAVASLSFSPFFAAKAQAQFATFDVGLNPLFAVTEPINTSNSIFQAIKEGAGDTIVWILVNIIIERIAASTINWINTGFKGSPAFVTDPETYFKNLGDQIAGQTIYNHRSLQFMCAPLRAKVQIALTQNYIQPFYYQCTLSDVGRNFDNFMNDFNQGGWDNFIEVSQRSQNNPLGLYNQWQNEIDINIGSALGRKEKELDWGKGFLSWKSCTKWSDPIPGYTSEARIGVTGLPEDEVNNQFGEIPARDVSGIPPTCVDEQINTPGSVISDQLNETLGMGTDRLQVADEINEIISALLNQLASKAIGAVGKGLRSLSSPGSGDNGGTYTEQLRNASFDRFLDIPAPTPCPDPYERISASQCGASSQVIDAISASDIGKNTIDGLGNIPKTQTPPPTTETSDNLQYDTSL